MLVPSSEQKQSGRTQTAGSQAGALLGSFSLSQVFSSEPSVQSFSPLQNKPRSIQAPSPQAKKPSWQRGSSVYRRGLTFLSLFFSLQFLTAPFQSQVCFSMSKYKPAGHLMA
uniref:Uncharacterized protein n=1 Tax=Cacopsylla melanoneura TaxID=428564 RepID=A0A8D8RH77_9HEMI